MDLGIPPIKIKMMLESNLLKSTVSVGRLAVTYLKLPLIIILIIEVMIEVI